MELSQDDIKLLLQLVNQLTFSPQDAKRIVPLVEKLEQGEKQPGVKIADAPEVITQEKRVSIDKESVV